MLGGLFEKFSTHCYVLPFISFNHFFSVPGEQNGHPPHLIRTFFSYDVPSRKHFFLSL